MLNAKNHTVQFELQPAVGRLSEFCAKQLKILLRNLQILCNFFCEFCANSALSCSSIALTHIKLVAATYIKQGHDVKLVG